MNLINEIRKGESDRLEFKEILNDSPGKWMKTAVAFANCRGGRILFGVSNDREIKGLDGDLFAIRDSISDAIVSSCSPPLPAQVSITMVGKLKRGVTVEKMRAGCSDCRNEAIALALSYMNIIEDWGSGILRIREELRNAGLRDLVIDDWPNAVRATLYRQRVEQSVKTSQKTSQKILSAISADSTITTKELADMVGLSQRAIAMHISSLRSAGLLRRIGPDKGGYWEVAEDLIPLHEKR